MLALFGMGRGKKTMLYDRSLSEEEEDEEYYIKEREKTGIRRAENCKEGEEETKGHNRLVTLTDGLILFHLPIFYRSLSLIATTKNVQGKGMTQDNKEEIPEVENSSDRVHVELGVENGSIGNQKGGIQEPDASPCATTNRCVLLYLLVVVMHC